MIRLVLQVLVVLSVSGLALAYLGTTYVLVGLIITAIALALLISRWKDVAALPASSDEDPQLSLVAVEFLFRLLLAMMLGAVWPSLPLIVLSGSSKSNSDGRSYR